MSFVLSAGLLVSTALDEDVTDMSRAVVAGVAYVLLTWPVANAVVPPGRPGPRPPPPPREPTPWG